MIININNVYLQLNNIAFALFQERLRSLNTLVHEIEGESAKGDQTLDNISKVHDKINQEGRFAPYNQVIFNLHFM